MHQSLYRAFLSDIIVLYWHRLIIGNSGTPFLKVSDIYATITIMVRYISLVFILIIFYLFSIIEFISSTKSRNNTEEAPFGILGASTEHENDLRVNIIVESEKTFLLQIERYSCD